MVSATTKLGGTAADVTVGRVAHGLMQMTWVPTPVPDEQCFEAIKAGIDALPAGTTGIINSGEFYAMDWGTGNLEMLSRFFAKYPEYADKTFLSVKGAVNPKIKGPDCSIEYLRAGLDNIERALGPIKKVDLFQPARIDPNIPIEKIMENLVTLVNEGKFSHIGLSECNHNTLRRAHAVHPVTAVEIEVSPWAYDDNQKKVIETAKELGISVMAYSPLGKGFITGQIKSAADLPAGDVRQGMTRFRDQEILKHNFAIVDALTEVAKRVGSTPAQLSIAWVAHLGPNVIPLPGSSKASRTLENLEAGDIKLSAKDFEEITKFIDDFEVKGDRYFGQDDKEAHLWG
ncbi:aldo/keto reductase [Ephemerocybe angulata]|uniref:Aldo/keto reductase n=1 Tax=Ephemerocybe angulata TaxID=980116 RepID=A0A8H6HNL8_9AGAR|nr:aldo/keto reductase [Tulosesus angulatus]